MSVVALVLLALSWFVEVSSALRWALIVVGLAAWALSWWLERRAH